MNGVMVVCQLIGCYMIVTLYCSITFKSMCAQSYLALPYDLRKIESDSDYANGLMYNIKMITTPLVSFERKFLGLALLA